MVKCHQIKLGPWVKVTAVRDSLSWFLLNWLNFKHNWTAQNPVKNQGVRKQRTGSSLLAFWYRDSVNTWCQAAPSFFHENIPVHSLSMCICLGSMTCAQNVVQRVRNTMPQSFTCHHFMMGTWSILSALKRVQRNKVWNVSCLVRFMIQPSICYSSVFPKPHIGMGTEWHIPSNNSKSYESSLGCHK